MIAPVLVSAALSASLTVPVGARAASTNAVGSGASVVSRDLTQPVSVSALKPAEVEEALAGIPLNGISATQLSEALAKLPAFSHLPQGSLQAALESAIKNLAAGGGTLGQLPSSPELVSELEGVLQGLLPSEVLSLLKEGRSKSSVLNEALGSLDPRKVLSALLSSSSEPEQLLGQVLKTPNSDTLETLLDTTLTGEPFTKHTVGALASEAGTTSEGLAKDFKAASSQLLPDTMALTAPLANGKLLGVLDAVEGVDVGTLTHEKAPEGSGSGAGGSGDGSGSATGGQGGQGGPGGTSSGSSGTPGTTIIDELSMPGVSAASSSAKAALAKIKIVSHKVSGAAVTLVVQVPAAGRLRVTGKDVRSASEQVAEAERVTVRVALTKAGAASLRKHRRRLNVKLDVSFAAVGGGSSAAATTARFG